LAIKGGGENSHHFRMGKVVCMMIFTQINGPPDNSLIQLPVLMLLGNVLMKFLPNFFCSLLLSKVPLLANILEELQRLMLGGCPLLFLDLLTRKRLATVSVMLFAVFYSNVTNPHSFFSGSGFSRKSECGSG
jgi:hypothetical protein